MTGGKIEDERGPAPSPAGAGEGPVIEGEFERLGEKQTGPHRRQRSRSGYEHARGLTRAVQSPSSQTAQDEEAIDGRA